LNPNPETRTVGQFATEEEAALAYLPDHIKKFAGRFDKAGLVLGPNPASEDQSRHSRFKGVFPAEDGSQWKALFFPKNGVKKTSAPTSRRKTRQRRTSKLP
jgi:hypothetical protein